MKLRSVQHGTEIPVVKMLSLTYKRFMWHLVGLQLIRIWNV